MFLRFFGLFFICCTHLLMGATQAHRQNCLQIIKSAPLYPKNEFHGRGIVVCAGGPKYLTNAWINLNFLRYHGCQLPVELWYIGENEITQKWIERFATIDVVCKDITQEFSFPIRSYMVKPLSLIKSSFEEVMMLDADNTPLKDPTYLFDDSHYIKTGALFWPDYMVLGRDNPVWAVLSLTPKEILSQESGQLVVNKRLCWHPLQLTLYMNQNSNYFYQILLGDKDTFFLAWRAAGQTFAMNTYYPGVGLSKKQNVGNGQFAPFGGEVGFLQRDFDGEPLFYHMIHNKWEVGKNFKFITNEIYLPPLKGEYLLKHRTVTKPNYLSANGTILNSASVVSHFQFKNSYPFVEERGYQLLNVLEEEGL